MKYDKQAALARRLFLATNEGKLDWKPSASEDAFQVSFPNYTVILHNNNDHYSIEVVDSQGQTTDYFTDSQLYGSDAETPFEADSWYRLFQELYGLARRRARGADKALDDILKELGE